MLDKYDIIIDASQMYSEKALGQVWAASLDTDDDEFVLKQHTIHIRNLNELINTIDARIERQAAANEDAVLLASMTGFGLYSALLLAVEIGDVSRFDSPKKNGLVGRIVPNRAPVRRPAVPWEDEKNGHQQAGQLDHV